MKQVICVKWGTAYGPEYVNRLYGMLRRHVTGDFRLVCLTDNAEGLRPEVDAYPLEELGCEWPKKSLGKWRKLVMWSADLGEKTGLSGPVLFIDLDSVIVDNIDGYFTHGHPDDVVLARKETPTSYHLSVVVDDARQGVTDVVRGQDLFWSTSVHRLLQTLLGLPAPRYRHHRLLRDADGQKLAKSTRSTSLRAPRQGGASPQDIRRMVGLA